MKFKKLFTLGCVLMSLGVFAGCSNHNSTSYNKNQTNSQLEADGWKSGTIPMFRDGTQNWLGSIFPAHSNFNHKIKFYCFNVTTTSKFGIDPIELDLNENKKVISSGCASSAFATINPHYINLGNGWFKLTSGGVYNPYKVHKHSFSSKNSLYYELHGTLNHAYGATSLIHENNNHTFTLWVYHNPDGLGKKTYYGNFMLHHNNM